MQGTVREYAENTKHMIDTDQLTIGQCFALATERYADDTFLLVPADEEREYHCEGFELSYREAAVRVAQYEQAFALAGYGHGHRVALLLGNRPEMILLKLALNSLGISSVPLNPDYQPAETSYVLQDSKTDLVITVASIMPQLNAALAIFHVASGLLDGNSLDIPAALTEIPIDTPLSTTSEASLLYTSGTTGKPKGCLLNHEYELMQGAWYCSRGGKFTVREAQERIYNPLPLFHVNAGIMHMFGSIVSGNCQIIPERFSRTRWWSDIKATKATGMHYLGIVIPALMNNPESVDDTKHDLRWGLGAGVEPSLHQAFEDRFGLPLIEIWGMTEMCRILANCHEPRQINTRAMGKAQPGLEVRVVDEHDTDVATGEPGEMLVRYNKDTPRRGAFSGYLNLPDATEKAWHCGWFHTGDTVCRDHDGMLYFVDRKKNIIRRSGENIAAAEVEACLQAHPLVKQVAVIAVSDDMRDEEVMACIVTNTGNKSESQARLLFDHALLKMTYFKVPGWIVFIDNMPITGTQKIQKNALFSQDQNPVLHPNAFDFRAFKKRQ